MFPSSFLKYTPPSLPASACALCDAAPLPLQDEIFDAAHRRVRKWTKGIHLFEYDYIFLPVNERWVANARLKATKYAELPDQEAWALEKYNILASTH